MKKICSAIISLFLLTLAVPFASAQVSPAFHPSTAPLVSLPVVINATTTGTTLATLTKLTGVNTALIAATTDNKNGVIVGVVVSGAGTTGSATLLTTGVASCVFDGTVTQNDFVTVSTSTAGDCHDDGATLPGDGSQVLGRVMSATASGAATYLALFNIVPTAGNTLTSLVQSQPTIAAAATLSPTCAANSGSLIYFGATTGEVITLPATPTPGCWFDFSITVSNTSNYNEIESGGSAIYFLGEAEHAASGIAPLDFYANGTSTIALKMDGAHLGGLIGSHFHVWGISATQWGISGTNEGTATMTTAFNTSD